MKSYEAQAIIHAAPDVVWSVLTDRAKLTSGGFGILRLDGEIRAGERIKLWSEVSPGRAFALKVSTFEPGRLMRWQSGMPLGVFKGERTFTLTPNADGTTFHMREVFSGPLSGLIVKSIPDLGPSFEKFATALKQMSEAMQ
ncbi:MAG: SRPBCC domain-containing protein [Rhodobacteraceae bacterium]|nr:SRPBCC domain-containing protein [Paracoccaceae bacterium]PHR62304.1 MAG: hypothetical protein COA47_04850 [Robiginitomaculum sp.]